MTKTAVEPHAFTVRQAAQRIGLGQRRVRDMIYEGLIQAVRTEKGRILITRESLDNYLARLEPVTVPVPNAGVLARRANGNLPAEPKPEEPAKPWLVGERHF